MLFSASYIYENCFSKGILKMKKILALLFLTVAFMALVACGGNSAANTTAPSAETTPAVQSTSTSKTASTTQTAATTTYRTEVFTEANGTVVQRDYYNEDKKIVKRETFYPENGLPKENVLYNEYEMPERYELFTRDENGKILERCLETGKYNKTGVTLEKKYVEIYNAKDVLTEETVYSFNEQGRAATGNVKRYDDKGNKTYQGVIYFYFDNTFKEVNGNYCLETIHTSRILEGYSDLPSELDDLLDITDCFHSIERNTTKNVGANNLTAYILSLEQVASLFEYVESQLEDTGCDHSCRYTQQWLSMNIPQEQHEAVLAEIEEMGGYCDCEVLMNCYEEYEEELYDEEE
jgi:hypothetical protein